MLIPNRDLMQTLTDPVALLAETFGSGGAEVRCLSAPGRVNLIGEHIDYHNLPVLPMAMQRTVRVAFRAREDHRIRAVSDGAYGVRDFEWTAGMAPVGRGDWENYLRAAGRAIEQKWGVGRGVDAHHVAVKSCLQLAHRPDALKHLHPLA